MTITHRRYKTAIITIGGATDYSCQVMATKPTNNTDDGDKFFTFCADGTGEGREETDDDWSVDMKWKSDWTPSGLNRYVELHAGETVELSINFDNDVTDWDRTWTGDVVLKSPGDGGDARAPQESEVTWTYIGKPDLTYA